MAVAAIIIARVVIFIMLTNELKSAGVVVLEPVSPISALDIVFVALAAITAYKAGSGKAFAGQPVDGPKDDDRPDGAE
jgi:hypothetical protein